MKPLLLILIIALSASSQTLTSDDWFFLGTPQNNYGIAQTFIKPSTIQRDGDIIKVSFKITFPLGPSWLTPFWKDGSLADIVRGEGPLTFNCKTRQLEGSELLFYDRLDKIVGVYNRRERVKERPGSISWAAFEYLCERPQSKPKDKPQLRTK
jgi:hypothetical protein